MGATSGAVLHIVDSLAFGGAQSILKDYFESRPDEKTLHLYALRVAPRQVNISHPNVHVDPSSARLSMAPLLELRQMVGWEGIGVLHCHLFRSQVFGYILKTLFFPQVALVFHEHGRVVGREGESALEALMFRLFLRLAWRRVDWFICISDYTRSRLLQLVEGARRRASVVANPIQRHAGPSGHSAILRSAGRRICRRLCFPAGRKKRMARFSGRSAGTFRSTPGVLPACR